MSLDKTRFLKTLEKARQKTGDHLSGKASALERVLEISRQIATLDLDAALALIVKHVLELTGARRGMVMLLDERHKLRFQYAVGLAREEVESRDFEISRSVTERAMAEKRVVVVEDAPTSTFKNQTSVIRLGLQAMMVIPLKAREDRVIGVMYVDTDLPEHHMSGEDTSVFSAFGGQAAVAIENARLHGKLREDCLFLKEPAASNRFHMFVYQSRAMQRVHQAIEQVLDNQITVLIHGESGTGKELAANAIHYRGARKNRKFVVQNAGALPETLLESELFGHRRGAFSGAVADKPGLFELADGGTVFLDEIGEASPALQVRLLRLLETRKFRRVGDTVERETNVRFVAATNRDLEQEAAAGRFREDLYYRLSVYPIRLPSLRERRDDIPLLVSHFVEHFNRELGKSIHLVPKSTMKMLTEREWKGNIRELKNFVYRMMVLSRGDELTCPVDDWRAVYDAAAEEPGLPDDGSLKTLQEVERDYIRFVLKRVKGNQSHAAKCLGLKRTTFLARLKKLAIDA